MDISRFHVDIWNMIIEELIIIIGIRNAALLRTTSKAFDAAIMRAICVSPVIDIQTDVRFADDYFLGHMGQSFLDKIFLGTSRSNKNVKNDVLVAIDNVNRKLDMLTGEMDEMKREKQHLAVAATISPNSCLSFSIRKEYDPEWDAQNIFCGAIVIGNLPLVKTLLEEHQALGSPIDMNGVTPYFSRPLVIAAACGHLEIVRYLLEKGAHSDLLLGCRKSFSEDHSFEMEDYSPQECYDFLRRGYHHDIPVLALSALRAAVLGQHKDVVRELLLPEYRLPISKVEFVGTLLAAAGADVELIHMLVNVMEGKTIPNGRGLIGEMVWLAVLNDRQEVVQMLSDEYDLDFHLDPSDWAAPQVSPLDLAASCGKTDMMRCLIARRITVHFHNYQNYNEAIDEAARKGHEAAVEMLCDLGADPAVALWSAFKHSRPRVTKLVLDKYPDLLDWERGREGRMMLCCAVTKKNLSNIELLVDRGVPLNNGYEDSSQIPINVAKHGSGQWVVDYLISLGAQDTDIQECYEDMEVTTHGIFVNERTWQWVSNF
ncbi:hypothetical protein E4U43_000230 [Claviceps pusilla]|uniref:Ankyrin n=1 Tax=Claviceps pusilla TaxID=123648 RepID=A0A9P7SWW2_9HYPO|nr:hypothetical protein E4U43_000230 [Claviceps pusilla]